VELEEGIVRQMLECGDGVWRSCVEDHGSCVQLAAGLERVCLLRRHLNRLHVTTHTNGALLDVMKEGQMRAQRTPSTWNTFLLGRNTHREENDNRRSAADTPGELELSRMYSAHFAFAAQVFSVKRPKKKLLLRAHSAPHVHHPPLLSLSLLLSCVCDRCRTQNNR
jgi:hypothetical protein